MSWGVGEVDGVVIKTRSIIGTSEWGAAEDKMIELMAAQLSDRLDMGESIADSFADSGDVSGGICISGYVKNEVTPAVPAVLGTDQTVPGGSCSANSFYNSGYVASNAIDNNPTETTWHTGGSAIPGWWLYDFGVATEIGNYTITALTYGSTNTLCTPKTWEFQGSADGSTWVTLDARSNQPSWMHGEKRKYTLAQAGTYRYYRIYITATYDDTWLAIGEIELCNPDIAANPRIVHPATITVTPYTPESTLEKVRVTLMVEDVNNSGAIALGDAATDMLQVYLSYDGNSSFGDALNFTEEPYPLIAGSNIYVFNSGEIDVSAESISGLGMRVQSFDRGSGAPEFKFHAYIIAGKEVINE